MLDKHDIAGLVIIQSPDFAEFLLKIDPSWSCTWLEKDKDGAEMLRFRARAVDFGGDLKARKRAQESTAGMLISFQEQAERWAGNMLKAMAMLGKHLAIEHRSIDET